MDRHGRELLVWWGDALLDAQHGKRVVSNWCGYDEVRIVVRPTDLERPANRPAAFIALVPAAMVAVASLGAGAWLQHTDARELHARAAEPTLGDPPQRSAPLPSWVPPELCVPPPSPSEQDDELAPVAHDHRAKLVAYAPRGDAGTSDGSSPMRRDARSPRLRTIAAVLESVDWQRPASAFQNGLETRAGDEWWTAGGELGEERTRIRGTGHGGGGRGAGTISLGSVATIGVGPPGRRGCTHMCCFQNCRRRRSRGPYVRLGTPTVIGQLDEDHVRRVARRHLGALTRCYRDALASDDALEGRITIQLFVSPYGNVRSAIVAHSDLDDAELEGCFVHAIRTWSYFMPTNRAMVSVAYPFRLHRP